MINLTFRWANAQDSGNVVGLVNSAYRGDSSRLGWTTEADLLQGLRVDADEFKTLLANPDTRILVAEQHQQLVGCIALEHQSPQVQLGMLAVAPHLQNTGIGSRLLQQAEQQAQQLWPVKQTVLWVIPCRHELIAYYQRRGYQASDQRRPFPQSPLWTPSVSGLELWQWLKHLD